MGTIVFTGGGTAGHVIPNVALIPKLQERGWITEYIGSATGIERELIGELEDVPYHIISTGKLRRYFSMSNFKDPFHVIKGIGQAYRLLKRIKPDIVFSKGGFVSVPVILASRLLGIPTIIHESDITPGLANKISIPFATKVCVTFPETMKSLPANKAHFTGSPIRENVYQGQADLARERYGLSIDKPIVLVMGGSLGSQAINRSVRGSLDLLLEEFQVVHICGKGNIDPQYNELKGYRQFEYVGAELPDLLAATDITVSRAGANAIFEFLALRIPMLLIPLPLSASRGDQLLNARSFETMGFCRVLFEEDVTRESLTQSIARLYHDRAVFIDRMKQSAITDSVNQMVELILDTSKQ
jgi:UDP-N-acetylglucosamine--N-acetylmuramyl-(pentapeptide) pyrophosphoryl-undecaprenol N-acetylglucosamine transferase